MTNRAPKTPETDIMNDSAKRSTSNAISNVVSNVNNGQAMGASGIATVPASDLLSQTDGKRFKMPTTLSEVIMDNVSDEDRKRLVTEIRREYQRQYYQKHKEKAKEYQRQYNLTHKKKARGGRGKANFECPREKTRSTFNTADLMHSPVEKTVKMLEKIINGDRMFTM